MSTIRDVIAFKEALDMVHAIFGCTEEMEEILNTELKKLSLAVRKEYGLSDNEEFTGPIDSPLGYEAEKIFENLQQITLQETIKRRQQLDASS